MFFYCYCNKIKFFRVITKNVLLSAGIANENGGITFIPVQVSVTGQSGAGLQPLTAQALTGSLNTQQLTTTMPAGTAHTSPTAGKHAKMGSQQGTLNRIQRTGSLCLFFRKVSKDIIVESRIHR